MLPHWFHHHHALIREIYSVRGFQSRDRAPKQYSHKRIRTRAQMSSRWKLQSPDIGNRDMIGP